MAIHECAFAVKALCFKTLGEHISKATIKGK